MNINNLPEELRELALLRSTVLDGCTDLQSMFIFSSAKERGEYWHRVNDGGYTQEDVEYARKILNKDYSLLIFN